jgi:hypothetical protein
MFTATYSLVPNGGGGLGRTSEGGLYRRRGKRGKEAKKRNERQAGSENQTSSCQSAWGISLVINVEARPEAGTF